LDGFLQWLGERELEPVYKHAYQRQAEQLRSFMGSVGTVGTREMMGAQQTPSEWAAMLDVPATLMAGTAVLPYETLAREMLEQYGKAKQQMVSMRQALRVWRLGEAERMYLLGEKTDRGREVLEPEEGRRLFEVVLNRLRLSAFWKVATEENRHSIEVDPMGRRVLFPAKRMLTAREVTYLPLHELVHVVGGHNGSKQACRLLGLGLPGYLSTEEGVAMMAELLGGSKFGYERQVMIAARYLAVAMMLKARWVLGKVEPVYNTQTIYETLRGYGVSAEVAGKILWRAMRGTSLRHEGIEVKVRDGRRVHRVAVAETFVRDEAYFRGFVRVLQWFNQRQEMLSGSEYVSCQLYGQRVCRKKHCMSCQMRKQPELAKQRQIRTLGGLRRADRRLRELGRDGMLELIQFLRPGKLQLNRMVNSRNPWYGLLGRDRDEGRVWYGDVLKARSAVVASSGL
jgi:hypothetical protein